MAFVIGGGLAIRLYSINSHSFWLDEAYSWTMATQYSFAEIIDRTARDFHPPLYFMLLKCWIAIFGDSEVAQRMLSVLLDELTMISLYVFCRDAFAEENLPDKSAPTAKSLSAYAGVLAGALYAANSMHIHWSIETRMYSMATLLSVVSSWVLLRGLWNREPRWWIAYIIVATALLYTHNYGVFTVFGQACFLIGLCIRTFFNQRGSNKVSRKVDITLRVMNGDSSAEHRHCSFAFLPPIAAMIAVGVGFLPWLSILLSQTQQAREDYWIPPLNLWTIPKTWLDLLIHENLPIDQRNTILALLVSVASVAILVWFVWPPRNRGTILVLIMIVSPVVCSGVISAVSLPIITSRHYLVAGTFFFCAVAHVVVKRLPAEVSVAAAVLLIVNMLYFHVCYRDELRISDDSGVRAVVGYVSEEIQPGDLIVVSDQRLLLSTRYYESRLPPRVRSFPVSKAKLLQSVPLITWLGSALIDDSDRVSATELQKIHPRRIWLIGQGFDRQTTRKELPLHDWEKQHTSTFRGNYYFEPEISASLLTRRN